MRPDTLDILRCPYCLGRFEVVGEHPHRYDGERLVEGTLACHCCTFPVVSGIPVLHLESWAVRAREALEAGRSDEAERILLSPPDPEAGARFQARAGDPSTTYRELVELLGASVEAGYFLYRLSDPTYTVARAVVEAVGGAVLAGGGRAIDVCGGSGHLTRVLPAGSAPPVIADLYFSKLWLARRFLAPDAELVCCDANWPLPFARGTFDFVLCSDIFHYIWSKRSLVSELQRLVAGRERGTVVIGHTHNQWAWSPSFGEPLPPEGYRALFEAMEPRLFAEFTLLAEVTGSGTLDLSGPEDLATIEGDPAMTIVASHTDLPFRAHVLDPDPPVRGELRLNPLYERVDQGDGTTRLRLRFPSEDYEDEYGSCRTYLPEEVTVNTADLAALAEGRHTAGVLALFRRGVVLDMPERYY